MGGEATDTPAAAFNAVYTDTVSSWLRKHGKAVRPQLDKRQLEALRECFDIIDTDGTGMITAGELCSVFTALGDHVSLEAVARVLDTIKFHGSDGIGFPDFVAILTRDSQDLESGQRTGKADVTTAYNIAIMARAYRRTKVLEAVFKDEGGWRAKFVDMHDRLKDRERQSHIRLLTESLIPLGSQHSMQSTMPRAPPPEEQAHIDSQKQGINSSQGGRGQVAMSRASSSYVQPAASSTRLGTGALSIVTAAIVGGLPSHEGEEDQVWGVAQRQRLATETSEETVVVRPTRVDIRMPLSAKAQQKLQALQEAADSVLTPRWQTQASTHQQPQRSGSFYLQPQAGIHEQPETGTHMQPPDTFSFSQQPAAALSSSQQPTAPFSFSQHPTAPFLSSQQPQQPLASDLQPQTDPRQQPQQPFSSSLQFQAAHDTDFQLAGGDRHQNLSMPVLPSKPSSDAAAADISSDQAAADHAADVKFAAGHMRSHEIGSSRSISNGKTAEQDAVAAVGGAGTFDTEVQQLGTSQGDAHDCAEAGPGRARGDVPLSVDSSSSSSSSGDDSCLSQAELQQTSVADSAPAQGQSVRSSRQGDTCSADKPLGSPVAVTDGRVLKPHNFADAAAAAGVDTADGAQPRVAGHAVEASKKSAGHAGRAVGLVGPTSPAHVASSLDVMIKTGHVGGTALSHLQYASPRSKLRQAAFLGHSSSPRRLAWNTSTNSHSAHQPLNSPLQSLNSPLQPLSSPLPTQGQQPCSKSAAAPHAFTLLCSGQAQTLSAGQLQSQQQHESDSPAGQTHSAQLCSVLHVQQHTVTNNAAAVAGVDQSGSVTAACSSEPTDAAGSASKAVICRAISPTRPAVPRLSLAAMQDRGKAASSARGLSSGGHGLSNDVLPSQTATADPLQRPATVQDPIAGVRAARQIARSKSARAPAADRPGSTAKPRSSFWKSSAAASQLPHADEEQPVKHMSARAPLTAPVLSPRAPWLQGAALTAAKFRQPSRQHTARLAQHACIQMQGKFDGSSKNAVWHSSMSKRMALQDRAVNAPIARGQQIKVATQAQVRMLAEEQKASLNVQ